MNLYFNPITEKFLFSNSPCNDSNAIQEAERLAKIYDCPIQAVEAKPDKNRLIGVIRKKLEYYWDGADLICEVIGKCGEVSDCNYYSSGIFKGHKEWVVEKVLENANEDYPFYEFVERLPKYPLNVGDVYTDPTGNCNSFLLIKALYYGEKTYQLSAWGVRVNSGPFYNELHTREEIEAYLRKKKMVFEKNIASQIAQSIRQLWD